MGRSIHLYDQRLCDYVIGTIAGYMDRPAFRAEVEEVFSAGPLLDYLVKASDNSIDADEMRLLLSDHELSRLELVFEDTLNRRWVASEPLHRRYVETLPEVRDHLSRQAAEEWSEACATFARRLEDRHPRLSNGIAIVREWVGRLRTLLRVAGAVNFLPAPEGGFPTPTCPEPPQVSCPPPSTPSRQDTAEDGGLRAVVAESLDIQREVRDLLVNQRTVKDFYSVEEYAALVGKSEYTCREWCRRGRIRATKKGSGRGKYQSWAISHEELLRYQKEGLLPEVRPSTK